MKSLYSKTLFSVVALGVAMGLLLFGAAGTFRYWQAWIFLAVWVGASLLTCVYLLKNDPALLERRMKGGPTAEKRTIQKVIMLFASIGFIGMLIVPALCFRLLGEQTPTWVAIGGDVLVAIGFYCVLRIYQENTYTSATIEIAKDQKVISTGPYAIVRHPMYASAFLYVLGTPLALGSYWGLLTVPFMMFFILWRLLDEEKFLAANLYGYAEYQEKVRYRLIPHVW